MSIFGDLEQFVAENLYPYRLPITIALVAALVLAAYVAYRRSWHLVVWRYKRASAVTAVILLIGVVLAGNYFLSPLWERSFLDEQDPLALASGLAGSTPEASPAPTEAAPVASEEAPFQARLTHQGEISGADGFHFGGGTAQLIETDPGQYTLRFEDFSVRNGPDLFVYLTPDKNSVDEALNLGDLKATDGAFNYEVPAGTDLSAFGYVIVWCRDFAVLFASAPLAAAN